MNANSTFPNGSADLEGVRILEGGVVEKFSDGEKLEY